MLVTAEKIKITRASSGSEDSCWNMSDWVKDTHQCLVWYLIMYPLLFLIWILLKVHCTVVLFECARVDAPVNLSGRLLASHGVYIHMDMAQDYDMHSGMRIYIYVDLDINSLCESLRLTTCVMIWI